MCCDLADYIFLDCLDYHGEHGQDLSCIDLGNDNNLLLEGACGSGMFHDCEGLTHTVRPWAKMSMLTSH